MKKISLVFFLLTSLYAGTWETPYPFNSIVISPHPEWLEEKDDLLHLKIHVSGLLNLSTFSTTDSSATNPLHIFFIYPMLAVNTRFKSLGFEISALQIVSATEYRWETDSANANNSLNVYRFNAQGTWQSLPWLEVSAGYNHYMGYRVLYDSVSLAQAPSFSLGAIFQPAQNLKLNLLIHSPARLYFDGPTDTLKLPLIILTGVKLYPAEKFDVFASARFSQVFSKNQDADSTGDFLKPFGFGAGADYKPVPSFNLRLMGDYSASSLYALEPLWSDEQGLVISLEGSWRKEPFVFSALIASGRYYASKADGFNSNSYIFRLGAAFEL